MIDMRIPAISYAAAGWPIFRCRTGAKVPATRRGFKDATTDVDLVHHMFTGHRRANIATPTGVRYDVLDLDVKPPSDRHPGAVDARTLIPRLQRGGWLDGAAGLAETRNGGLHIYYPTSAHPSGSIAHLGVDFKARGGYVLLPPSKVASDFPDGPGRYRWLQYPGDPGEGTPLDWPALRAELDPRPEPAHRTTATGADPGRRLAGLCRTVAGAIEGNRNATLFWAAAQLGSDRQLTPIARRALLDAAITAGLPEAESQKTMASAARATGGGT